MNRTRSFGLLLLSCLWACKPEYGVQRQERLDVFRQNRLNAIDLLLVVDNSCSMVDEQEHLAASFHDLIDTLQSGQSDWRVAVTTSEPTLPEYRALLMGGTDEIVIRDPIGRQIDRVAYDDRLWPIDRGVALERCSVEGSELSDFQLAQGAGSPGEQNGCGPPPSSTTESQSARPPEPGELVVSEFMPWPEADDCAWIEIANVSLVNLELSGLSLRDDGADFFELPDEILSPGELFVVGAGGGCSTAVDLVATDGLHLADGARWVDPGTRSAEALFAELVAVGTGAFGLEMGMENALLTLEAQQSEQGRRRFLRDEADLAMLFFSDEDDLSPWSVAHYTDALRAIKGSEGQREAHRVRVGAAVGDTPAPPGEPSCSSELGQAVYAPRYVALAEQTGGLHWSICGDLSDVAGQAGLTFSELLFEFQLSAIPAIDTMVVEEYASEEESSYLGPMQRGDDYELESRADDLGQESVWMVFPEDRVLPGAIVTIRYEIVADSVELELGEP